MSAAPEIVTAASAPGAAARLPPALRRADEPAPPLARRVAIRFRNEWAPRAAWAIGRTGRAGLVGVALLLGATLFLISTHLGIVGEVDALRADVAAAQGQPRGTPDKVSDPGTAMRRALPARNEMPAILRQLFHKATQARLAVDVGKYEINTTASSGIVRYQIAFPVSGPYPQIRAFIDATLATMPALALTDLALDRKSIADGDVEAQLRMTVYTVATGANRPPPAGSTTAGPAQQGSPRAPEALRASERVVARTHAAALFAQRSWHVLPPPPPPTPAPPPPEPAAPPFPYISIGSFLPEGRPPVYFLARGDRVIDAHVGDRLDGVYQFESAAGSQLVFVYLPLNIRQTVPVGAPK